VALHVAMLPSDSLNQYQRFSLPIVLLIFTGLTTMEDTVSGKIESKQSAVFIHGDNDGRRIMESVLRKVLDNTSLSWFLLGMSEMLEEVSEMDEGTASGKPCSEQEAELAAEKESVDAAVAFVVSCSFWLVESALRTAFDSIVSWCLGISEIIGEVSETVKRPESDKICLVGWTETAELGVEKEFVDVDVYFVVSWSFWLVETLKRSFASETSPPAIVFLHLLV